MTPDAENHTLQLLRRLRREHSARFGHIDTTLAEVLTQLRIHGTHIASALHQRNSGPELSEKRAHD